MVTKTARLLTLLSAFVGTTLVGCDDDNEKVVYSEFSVDMSVCLGEATASPAEGSCRAQLGGVQSACFVLSGEEGDVKKSLSWTNGKLVLNDDGNIELTPGKKMTAELFMCTSADCCAQVSKNADCTGSCLVKFAQSKVIETGCEPTGDCNRFDFSDANEFKCAPKWNSAAGTEICDGLDNNCDGQVDENFELLGSECTAGLGVCQTTGVMICAEDGKSLVCNVNPDESQKQDALECDGRDLNCDGVINQNGCPCTVGESTECTYCGQTGTQSCEAKSWGVCVLEDGSKPSLESDLNNCGECGNVCNVPANANATCSAGECGFVCKPGFVNVNNNTADGCEYQCYVTSGGIEACDGVDNNCDGRTDEGCFCISGAVEPCGSAIGACQQGTRTCSSDGQWGDCVGGITSTEELCNGVDDDCDGYTDEGFVLASDVNNCGACGHICPIYDNTVVSCEAGECQYRCITNYVDVNGDLASADSNGCECHDQGIELCGDNIDNDCDGEVDEGFASIGAACSVGFGVCRSTGEIVCAENGLGVVCNAEENLSRRDTSKSECDGEDWNCNGSVEMTGCSCIPGQSESCRVGCADGTRTCGVTGVWSDCLDAQGVKLEVPTDVCGDGIDNDCDGQTDEDATANQQSLLNTACTVGQGACARTGVYICSFENGQPGVVCSVEPAAPQSEICNGVDDNCNGTVDDGELCTRENANTACTNGACALVSCEAGFVDLDGKLDNGCEYECTVSNGGVETCDGKDNDCDGEIDEGDLCTLANATSVCEAGRCEIQSCTGGFHNIDGNPANGCEYECTVSNGGVETCDGLDNNCNGETDEGLGCDENDACFGKGNTELCNHSGDVYQRVTCVNGKQTTATNCESGEICEETGGVHCASAKCANGISSYCDGTSTILTCNADHTTQQGSCTISETCTEKNSAAYCADTKCLQSATGWYCKDSATSVACAADKTIATTTVCQSPAVCDETDLMPGRCVNKNDPCYTSEKSTVCSTDNLYLLSCTEHQTASSNSCTDVANATCMEIGCETVNAECVVRDLSFSAVNFESSADAIAFSVVFEQEGITCGSNLVGLSESDLNWVFSYKCGRNEAAELVATASSLDRDYNGTTDSRWKASLPLENLYGDCTITVSANWALSNWDIGSTSVERTCNNNDDCTENRSCMDDACQALETEDGNDGGGEDASNNVTKEPV